MNGSKQQVTYERVWDGNTQDREGRNGRIYESVVGWRYCVRMDGEMVDGDFLTLRDVKRAYPHAKRIRSDE